MIFFVYFFSVFFCFVAAKNEEYKGYKVYNIAIESQSHQDRIISLKNDLLDFWRLPNFEHNTTGKVMVPPSHFDWFEDQLTAIGVEKDVHIEDVHEHLMKAENTINYVRSDTDYVGDYDDDNSGDGNIEIDDNQPETPFDIKAYQRYDDILKYLDSLEEKYKGSAVKFDVIQYGITEQNRKLVYIKVTNAATSTSRATVKPIVVVEAAINPRDWITIPAALNVVDQILEESKFIKDLEWIIIPVTNPDGYEYSHTNLRLWTKSRSTRSNLGIICPGVNINRNFDLDWLHFDSSSSPCSHLYAGVEAFSEIEAQMIKDIIQENKSRIKLYISLQNNGGYISYPWNYERAASGMFRQHHLLGLEMVKSMKNPYKLGVGSSIFDRASGTSSDYARENDILYTFNIDVAQGDDGVVIPETDIGEIVDDVWKAIAVAADEMIKLYV
ncbi:carboxypeptidase B-like [Trichoplusia ni]|uniref:Carboxypeptidase B-like n=1 Tax=Trichoplusia ni TaxID=7111 RepID=A0A7E5W773_TRINI|nr:carboxypeptidase B-like [Trichoplusia ni]